MSDAVVLRERRGAVEILTINRPKALNALNSDVLDALGQILESLRADGPDALRAVVLTGAGKAFVAGADIAEMQGLDVAQAEAFAWKGHRVGAAIAALKVPVIAAVNGFALGGGCEIAMCCDILLAGPFAKFGQPEVKLGVIPGFGGTQRLSRRVGIGRALDLCLTGRIIDVDEALAIGLADRKVSEDVVGDAVKLAELVAANGPVAVDYVKRVVHAQADSDLSLALAAERDLFARCFETTDQKEGMAAFLAKRPAAFTGR